MNKKISDYKIMRIDREKDITDLIELVNRGYLLLGAPSTIYDKENEEVIHFQTMVKMEEAPEAKI